MGVHVLICCLSFQRHQQESIVIGPFAGQSVFVHGPFAPTVIPTYAVKLPVHVYVDEIAPRKLIRQPVRLDVLLRIRPRAHAQTLHSFDAHTVAVGIGRLPPAHVTPVAVILRIDVMHPVILEWH